MVHTKQPFESVVAEHGAKVLAVCRVLLGRNSAEDAWSDTFLSALRAYPQLPHTANVEAWLVTIAHHKAIDHARAATRRPTPTTRLPETPTDPTLTDGQDLHLWRCVGDLPDKQRQVLAYRYLAGLPYAAIASIVGGTAAAARRAAADGIANLRKSYPDLTQKGPPP